ncbi:aminotransferase class III-fold pyridoxal phosphate-dependent enzyme, partial [Craterilacuibacter sp.]|uniref:aminotransferase class III-fold pyridoxal phosphate-dependent enzyme n=1 Tax=Craterilacuibacter sp. TaxID=2870909 RepID=UPI003F3A781A
GWRVPSPDARGAQAGESARDVALRAAQSLENLLAKHHTEIAALIVEPLVQGAAGMAMYDAAYLGRARELCDHYRVHLIADEIAVGFGRSGTLFACEQAGIRPDFLCLSKGITGGTLPLSCVLTTDTVYQAFYHDDVTRGFLHSHSYTGNALACSAALAVLDIFAEDDVLARNREAALRFDALLAPLQAHPQVRHWRRCGMIWAFDVDSTRADFAQAFFSAMLAQGCLVRPIGKTVYFMPPYVVAEDDMALLRDATLATLDLLAQDKGSDARETPLP